MFTQKSLQHTIAQLQERIQELEAELKQKDIEKQETISTIQFIVQSVIQEHQLVNNQHNIPQKFSSTIKFMFRKCFNTYDTFQ